MNLFTDRFGDIPSGKIAKIAGVVGLVGAIIFFIFWFSNKSEVKNLVTVKPKTTIEAMERSARNIFRNRKAQWNRAFAVERRKTTQALAEVARLKEYQVALLDSIQKLQLPLKPDDKPDTKKDEKKTVTTGTGSKKSRTNNNCKCPPSTRANTETAWAKYGTPSP